VKLSNREAEDLLHLEAHLLDERRLEEWLELFTKDGTYWLPLKDDTDPIRHPSIVYEDHKTRTQRVHQLLHEAHYAQLPPSRTIHLISNVWVADDGEGDGTALVRCNLVLFELRPGHQRQPGLGEQRILAGRCEYRLRREDRWLISQKKVVLLNRDLPLENLSFIV
jgi:3-phenylpropionate/cinnamic acid dioxygenase small subunit